MWYVTWKCKYLNVPVNTVSNTAVWTEIMLQIILCHINTYIHSLRKKRKNCVFLHKACAWLDILAETCNLYSLLYFINVGWNGIDFTGYIAEQK
jgi:hypothetical protein